MTDRAFDLRLVPEPVHGIARRLRDAGKRAWVVGGCVRDSLLGKTASDWDLCTDALPDELLAVFPRAIPTGLQHGTVTVVEKKQHFEVTTLRGEGTYTDGRRPDSVEFTSDIVRDLARRDFTVNAIAVDPVTGTIVDPFDGQRDLAARVLRAVGEAEARFGEDGLRALRAARFAATLEFELDPRTRAAIRPTLSTFRKVSAERVRDEWTKTMKARAPSRAFEVMRTEGLLEVTCPELLEGVGMDQNKWHAFDVWGHAMACLDACPGDPVLRISALLHDVGKPRTRAFSDKTNDWTFYEHDRVGAEIVQPIVERLRFSTDEQRRVVHLVRHHLFHYTPEWTDAAVRRWIQRVGKDRLDDLYRLNEADVRGKGRDCEDDLRALASLRARVDAALASNAALSLKELHVGGRELMAELGLAPGRHLGELLATLLDEVVAEPARNEREALLDRAAALAEERGLAVTRRPR